MPILEKQSPVYSQAESVIVLCLAHLNVFLWHPFKQMFAYIGAKIICLVSMRNLERRILKINLISQTGSISKPWPVALNLCILKPLMIFLCLLLARRTMGKTARCFPFDCCNMHRYAVSILFHIGDTNRTMIKLLIHNSGRLLAKSQQPRVAPTHSSTLLQQRAETIDYQFLYHT